MNPKINRRQITEFALAAGVLSASQSAPAFAFSIFGAPVDTDKTSRRSDMHIPPGGGPGPHRHDFEETFIVLDGEIQATFRGKKSIVRAGATINIPANAPHQFHNASTDPARLICICSPAGQEKFFLEVGVPVATRTTSPPKLDDKEMATFLEKAKALAPRYHTELLKEA